MAITPLVLTGASDFEYPASVSVHPAAVASILDHHLRRPKNAGSSSSDGSSSSGSGEQDRVIGTLMGTRTEAGHVQVFSSFGVPFGEVEGKLLLDTDCLRQQLEVVSRASPKLTVVGWYATHPELNSWTPLIHDEYASLASITPAQHSSTISSLHHASHAPIHLTIDVQNLALKAYASSKLGMAVDSSNRTFVPLQTELSIAKGEQAGLEVLTKHSVPTIRSENPANPATNQLLAPMVTLHNMLQEVSSMLATVLSYVAKVNEGSQPGDAKVGRYLLETFDSIPLAASSKASFDEDFNSHLADLLMVSYLANVVRVNLEVATRASMLHDARLAPRSV